MTHDDSVIPGALAGLVDQYGPALFNTPERLRLLLVQADPEAGDEIDALLTALDAQVPQRLLAAHGDEELRNLFPRLVDAVGQRHADRAVAVRAVRSWALALALPVDQLDRRPSSTTPMSPPIDFASVVTPLAKATPPWRDVVPPVRSERIEPIAEPPKSLKSPEPPVDVRVPGTPDAGFAGDAPIAAPPPSPMPAPAVSRIAPSSRKGLFAVAAVIVLAIVGVVAWRMRLPSPGQPSDVATAPPTAVAGRLETQSAQGPARPDVPDPATPPGDAGAIASATTPAPAPASIPASVAASSPPAAPSPPDATDPKAVAQPPTAVPPTLHPSIARIDARPPNTSERFVVRLTIAGPVDAVAAVEQRSIDASTGRTVSRVVPYGALVRTAPNVLGVPVRAPDAAGRLVADFLVVDRGGVRSASKRAVFDVAAVPKPVERASAAATAVCTRSNCGSVVAVRPAEGSGIAEIIVRMDDRTIMTVRQNARLPIGSRVMKSGDRYLPI